MCLHTITIKRVLKKDLKVWKAMLKDKPDATDDRGYIYNEKVNKVKEQILIPSDYKCMYKAGFHCFLKRKDAKNWCSSKAVPLPFIIPSGTSVQYGRQLIGLSPAIAVVTPIIINPRII